MRMPEFFSFQVNRDQSFEFAVIKQQVNVEIIFIDLNDRYLEKDLEDAILRDIEQFLLELGSGFSFIARQKRIQIDEDDFYIDLLFYNRKLKRLYTKGWQS